MGLKKSWNTLFISLGCFLLGIHTSHAMFLERVAKEKVQESEKAAMQRAEEERARSLMGLDDPANQSGSVAREDLSADNAPRERAPEEEETPFIKQKNQQLAHLQQQIDSAQAELVSQQSRRNTLQSELTQLDKNIKIAEEAIFQFEKENPVRMVTSFIKPSVRLNALYKAHSDAIRKKQFFSHSKQQTLEATQAAATKLHIEIAKLKQEHARVVAADESQLLQLSSSHFSPISPSIHNQNSGSYSERRISDKESVRSIPELAKARQLPNDIPIAVIPPNCYPNNPLEFDIQAYSAEAKEAYARALAGVTSWRGQIAQTEKQLKAIPVYSFKQRAALYKAVSDAQSKFRIFGKFAQLEKDHLDYLDALSKSSLSPEEQHEKYAEFRQAVKKAKIDSCYADSFSTNVQRGSTTLDSDFNGKFIPLANESVKTATQSEQIVQTLLKELQDLQHRTLPLVSEGRALATSLEHLSNPEHAENIKALRDFVSKELEEITAELSLPRSEDSSNQADLEQLEEVSKALRNFLDLTEKRSLPPDQLTGLLTLIKEIQQNETALATATTDLSKQQEIQEAQRKLNLSFLLELQRVISQL